MERGLNTIPKWPTTPPPIKISVAASSNNCASNASLFQEVLSLI